MSKHRKTRYTRMRAPAKTYMRTHMQEGLVTWEELDPDTVVLISQQSIVQGLGNRALCLGRLDLLP